MQPQDAVVARTDLLEAVQVSKGNATIACSDAQCCKLTRNPFRSTRPSDLCCATNSWSSLQAVYLFG